MNKDKKKFFNEIKDAILSIKDIVEKYGLGDEFIAAITVGIVESIPDSVDKDGEPVANMSLISYIHVDDEEELDDLLSYAVEIYSVEQEQIRKEDPANDPSKIDYWLKFGNSQGGLN